MEQRISTEKQAFLDLIYNRDLWPELGDPYVLEVVRHDDEETDIIIKVEMADIDALEDTVLKEAERRGFSVYSSNRIYRMGEWPEEVGEEQAGEPRGIAITVTDTKKGE